MLRDAGGILHRDPAALVRSGVAFWDQKATRIFENGLYSLGAYTSSATPVAMSHTDHAT
jgi:hypothetical protein